MNPNEMTDSELNDALAIVWREWLIEKVADCYPGFWCEPNYREGLIPHIVKSMFRDDIWRPTHDLNQVYELESNIPVGYFHYYIQAITNIVAASISGDLCNDVYAVTHATARQKCEALLQTFREGRNE